MNKPIIYPCQTCFHRKKCFEPEYVRGKFNEILIERRYANESYCNETRLHFMQKQDKMPRHCKSYKFGNNELSKK